MNERGQALIETLLLGLLLLVPLMWTLMVLSELHAAALAASSAVRDAGVVAAEAASENDARAEIDRAVYTAFLDQGLPPGRVDTRWDVVPRFERGARVEIAVRFPVRVLRIPFVSGALGPSIWIDAKHVARLHPFVSR